MIDKTNKEDVLENLDSIVWVYKIQIFSLDALIEIAENIDEIKLTKEEKSEQEDNWEETEIPKKYRHLKKRERVNLDTHNLNIPPPIKPPTAKSIEISEIIKEMFETLRRISARIEETKQKVLLRSLLIYSMSIWEGFLRDYLRIVLSYNWEVLKNVQKEIEHKFLLGEILDKLYEYETLQDFRSELINELIDEYLFKLFYKPIDEISKELSRLHLIELNEFQDWTKLKEAYYKRNIVTHNNGIINRKYYRDINLPDCEIGEEVKITAEYLRDVSNTLDNFIDFVHTKICNKYKLTEY